MTARVRLRPIEHADLDYVLAVESHPDIAVRWRNRGATVDPAVLRRDLFADVLVWLMIVEADTDVTTGWVVGYGARLEQHVKLGVVVDPRNEALGLGAEAALLAIQYLFDGWPFQKIYIEGIAANLERVGPLDRHLDLESRLTNHEFFAGDWVDHLTYALTRDRWNALRGRFASIVGTPSTTSD